ncbi:MAG: ATP-binding cassette domain-containing protein [Deltaproteobacteria bacterium]|nr:ATP-binding cassette domain-containing protein [Deltaproteobacteria bacterium]
MNTLLQVTGLHVHYGAIEAVKGIDLSLAQGRITALLGANGAGKSTTLLTLSGLVRASEGSIDFDGVELRELAPHQIVSHGVVQVPEGREILTTLTVRENLLLGGYRRHDNIAADFKNVLEWFPRLNERLDGAAGNLSGGEQQMLAIARALMAQPRLLVLDEPSMGLAPLLVREIFKILRELNAGGLTIFLVEQNARQALKIAHHAYVMENGKLVLSAPAADMLNNSKVVEAYLGA